MLDPNLIRTEPDAVRRALVARGDFSANAALAARFAAAAPDLPGDADPAEAIRKSRAGRELALAHPADCAVPKVDEFLALDARRRAILGEVEAKKAERNAASKEIGMRKKRGEPADDLIAAMGSTAERIAELDTELRGVEEARDRLLLSIPNAPHAATPLGATEDDNPVVRVVGEPKKFDFEPKDHVELAEALDIADFRRAANVSGARFVFMKGLGARLERALISFMVDLQVSRHGRTELFPPFLTLPDAMVGTGQLPKFDEDLFKCRETGHYLIPTAEVPVTNFHRGETLDAAQLPLRYVAYSACFRAEAGTWGKDMRGMIRLHQFNKVEIVTFSRPEEGDAEHARLVAEAETVLAELGLPYRVVALSSGDIGFSAARCFDLEVWLPSQKRYREISSCSTFGDFQARRADIRFKDPGGKPRFVHTLNGSALAVGRTAVALLENGQRADGSIDLPACLAPYMGGVTRIEAPAR